VGRVRGAEPPFSNSMPETRERYGLPAASARGGNFARKSVLNEEGGMATRKQKARAAAAGNPLSDKPKPAKKTSKVKKTSRGK
jgi:hypothetical protein